MTKSRQNVNMKQLLFADLFLKFLGQYVLTNFLLVFDAIGFDEKIEKLS